MVTRFSLFFLFPRTNTFSPRKRFFTTLRVIPSFSSTIPLLVLHVCGPTCRPLVTFHCSANLQPLSLVLRSPTYRGLIIWRPSSTCARSTLLTGENWQQFWLMMRPEQSAVIRNNTGKVTLQRSASSTALLWLLLLKTMLIKVSTWSLNPEASPVYT